LSYFGQKYPSDRSQMYFDGLQRRLIAVLRTRLQNGELTERRLAHLTGISQPHVHNVLKGARILSVSAADTILRRLGLTVTDLLEQYEPDAGPCSRSGGKTRCIEVPVLEGWLGPGLPLPREPSRVEGYPFPSSFLLSVENPLVARVAQDTRMSGLLRENDLVLLDQSPARRLDLGEDGLYVVSRYGEGLVRRLRMEREDLLLLRGIPSEGSESIEALPLKGCHLLDVVKARVAWIGRALSSR
jgi:transcriptional regulator with XRE-family HTH domain